MKKRKKSKLFRRIKIYTLLQMLTKELEEYFKITEKGLK